MPRGAGRSQRAIARGGGNERDPLSGHRPLAWRLSDSRIWPRIRRGFLVRSPKREYAVYAELPLLMGSSM